MELRHLKYFVAVAEELHFARAAARLNIAAPTLSHQIRALETMLGAKLFARKTNSAVAVTHAGKRFLAEAQETLKQADHAELVGRRAARGEAGSIAVGYVFSAGCSGMVSATLAGYRKSHPEVSFQLARMQTFAQFKALIDGSLDIGIHARAAALSIRTVRLPGRPAAIHGWRCRRGTVWPRANSITPPCWSTRPSSRYRWKWKSDSGGNIAAISPPGVSLRIVERAPDAFTVMTLVAAGVGIGVLSGTARMHHHARHGLSQARPA